MKTSKHNDEVIHHYPCAEGILAEFLSWIGPQVVTVRDEVGRPHGLYGHHAIQGELLGRWETENNRIWIRRSAARKYCADCRAPENSIEEHLKSLGALIGDDERKNLGRGFQSASRQRCLLVDAAKIGLLVGTANTTEGDEDDD